MADKSFWSDKKDKTWLKNFWYYYRIHVIVGIIAIIVLGFTIHDCATRIDPDISADYIGRLSFSDDKIEAFKQYFAAMIKDADGKSGCNVGFVQHTVVDTEKGGDAQMAMAISQAIMIEMSVGESYLYFIGDEYIKQFEDAEILCDVSDLTGGEKGTHYVDVSKNKLFCKLFGEYDVPVYMCVREITGSVNKKNLPKAQIMQDNAKVIFSEFLKEN